MGLTLALDHYPREPDAQATAGSEWPASLIDLYRAQYTPMVRLAYLLTGSSAVAEDVVQEAFIRVRARLGSVDRPVAYLRAAVVNGSRNHHRHVEVERRLAPLSAAPEGFVDQVDELGDALATLPERQRTVLVLRYYQGLSEAEIAAVLDCRAGTVKSLAHRGLASLRKVIAP
ncbi:MAG: RNA polymerase sigma factor [Acidimicrobiales bacterium]